MKTLNRFIKESLQCKAIYNESLLDDEEDLINNSSIEIIEKFIKDNYKVSGKLDIKESNNIYIVNCNGDVRIKNDKITQLTNGFFEWGEVKGYFSCSYCKSLTSLQGAPKKVGEDFDCRKCTSLKSLQGAPEKVGRSFYCSICTLLKDLTGAPEKVGRNFDCSYCESLTSLEGAPEKVGGSFDCDNCKSLTSLEGAPKEIGWSFYCFGCELLTSLEGAPKKVGGDFDCRKCGIQFTKEDIEKVSKVKGKIIV